MMQAKYRPLLNSTPACGLLLMLVISGCGDTASPTEPVAVLERQQINIFEHREIDEASGLTRSNKRDDLLWVHNDSGDDPRLFAVGTDGQHLGVLNVDGVSAYDWEDITSFSRDGKDYLLIGDVGDNNGFRSSITFHIIEEPDISELEVPFFLKTKTAWTITAAYPDGARDCEGVAVDPLSQEIILISKRDSPPRLYSLPVSPADGELTVTYLGEVTSIPKPNSDDLSKRYGKNLNRPTALDISPNGRMIGLLTYKESYLFTRTDGHSWAATLNQPPDVLKSPSLQQAEAGGFGPKGDSWFVGSERLPALLVQTKL